MSEALLHPSVGTGALIAVLGYAVVFFGLVLLLAVIAIIGRIMISSQKKAATAAVTVNAGEDGPTAVITEEKPPAKGTAGELKLHDVSPRDAALIMAIVAHRLGKPINELRFRSIKEVKDE